MKSLPLAYIAIYPNLPDSKHFDDLKEALGVSEFLTHALITKLWTYAADNAPDGRLTVSLSWVVKKIGWDAKWCSFEKAAKALIEAGFIEPDGYTLHAWEDRQPCIENR